MTITNTGLPSGGGLPASALERLHLWGPHPFQANLAHFGSIFQSRSRSRLKITNQTLLENFQSKSAEKISIKVCLRKVKLFLSSNNSDFTTEHFIRQPVFNQRSLEKFQSRSAENFSIKA
jgi:hypothetical protein